jgi:hypothetical protein
MRGKYYTFIVRIHSESEGKFRGSIQHIRTQEEVHFDSFEDMKAFMDKNINLTDNELPEKKDRISKK